MCAHHVVVAVDSFRASSRHMADSDCYYTGSRHLGVLVYQRKRTTNGGKRAWRMDTHCYLTRTMLR